MEHIKHISKYLLANTYTHIPYLRSENICLWGLLHSSANNFFILSIFYAFMTTLYKKIILILYSIFYVLTISLTSFGVVLFLFYKYFLCIRAYACMCLVLFVKLVRKRLYN